MPIQITDHALQRFVERGSDVPTDNLRAHLLASLARAADAAASIGITEYLIVLPPLTYVVRDAAVITILRTSSPFERAQALRRTGAA